MAGLTDWGPELTKAKPAATLGLTRSASDTHTAIKILRTPNITFQSSSLAPALADQEIHVWSCPLDAASGHSTISQLSFDERVRADKFKFAIHRNRYIAGRGFLRKYLGMYLQIPPEALQFTYGLRGKPGIAMEGNLKGIQFNLSHSEDLAVLAVTRTGAVGIDVEQIHPIPDMGGLIQRFCSNGEWDRFKRLSPDEKPLAFFKLWTRKEAFLKATGEGIGERLNQVEVSFEPGEPARFVKIHDNIGETDEWKLFDLQISSGFVAAVAIKSLHTVKIRQYTDEVF